MVARLPAPRRRAQLLAVALEVFGELGYHQASMDAVAEAAGVTKPVLYQHFASKRDLYLELLNDVGNQLIEAILAATAGASSPREQVEAGFGAYFSFVGSQVNAFRLLFDGGLEPDEEAVSVVARVELTMADAIAVLIEANLAPEHRRLLADGLVGLAEATSRHWVRNGLEPPPDVLAGRVADLAWAGLRGVRPDLSSGGC